jgi:hypothetical protein
MSPLPTHGGEYVVDADGRVVPLPPPPEAEE